MLLVSALTQTYRRLKLSLSGASLGQNVLLHSGVTVRRGIANSRPGTVAIRDGAKLTEGVLLDAWGGKIEVGKNTFIGPYSVIYGHGGVTVGDNCLIAEHCSIHSANHTISDKETLIRSQPDILNKTTIGNDVWIAAGARILAGVTVGDGCVVGAGAVVTKDLEPYSVAYGVPARKVRDR